tara:strand:+ start:753 stop:1133 length:381 start_codon:yes stop_codon:yes gene_type:complete
MITITLNITNLNDSLQVGDIVYAANTASQTGSNDQQATPFGNINTQNVVGVLRRITTTGNTVILDVDETVFIGSVPPTVGQFLMFSKWNQTDGDLIGYFAQANFVNDSKEKAEMFSVGSEITISSK